MCILTQVQTHGSAVPHPCATARNILRETHPTPRHVNRILFLNPRMEGCFEHGSLQRSEQVIFLSSRTIYFCLLSRRHKGARRWRVDQTKAYCKYRLGSCETRVLRQARDRQNRREKRAQEIHILWWAQRKRQNPGFFFFTTVALNGRPTRRLLQQNTWKVTVCRQ